MKDLVLERFENRIIDMGLTITHIADDGLIHLTKDDISLQISLDNVRKSYEDDRTFDHLDNLVASIHSYLMGVNIPDWEECKKDVYLSLFPSDFDFGNYPNDAVTSEFNTYYVYFTNNQYVWIDHDQIKLWDITVDEFKLQVRVNMKRLLSDSKVEIADVEGGKRLAYFVTEIEGLKSALLFAENLKEIVKPLLGWPVYCVLPVRDFCYLFSETDKDELIGSLGEVVLKEYDSSGYEITTEVLKISDEGIESIWKY